MPSKECNLNLSHPNLDILLSVYHQVEGMGIASLSSALEDLGYTEHEDRLVFETKKLQVFSSGGSLLYC